MSLPNDKADRTGSTADNPWQSAVSASIGVLQAPAVITIYDDGYGISVPNEVQLTKGDLSALLTGFDRKNDARGRGFQLFTVEGWNYPALLAAYAAAVEEARLHHIPAILHLTQMTQPQGHSTSGSHERYKSAKRLAWEVDMDPLPRLRSSIVEQGLASPASLDALEAEGQAEAQAARDRAWAAVLEPLRQEASALGNILEQAALYSTRSDELNALSATLHQVEKPERRLMSETARKALLLIHDEDNPAWASLTGWQKDSRATARRLYSAHLVSETQRSPVGGKAVAPVCAATPRLVRGFDRHEPILLATFAFLSRDISCC